MFNFSIVYKFMDTNCNDIMQLIFPDVVLGYSGGLLRSKFVFVQTTLSLRTLFNGNCIKLIKQISTYSNLNK